MRKDISERLNEKNPKIEELKEKILNYLRKKGVNVAGERILREKEFKNEEREDIGIALSELINKGKIPSSATISEPGTGKVIVQSFGMESKTRLGGKK